MEKRLIKAVCERSFLYAVDDIHYRDRQMRAIAWTDIGKELGMSAQQCKESWRKLRNCYLNAINRRQHKNIPKWKFETEMAFLLPYLDSFQNRSQAEHFVYSPSTNEIAPYQESPASPDPESLQSPISPERPESPEAILPEAPDVDVASNGGQRFFSMEEEPQETIRRPDEIEMMFLSLSETVRRLRPLDQARIKMQLCNMVYEAEIQMLERQEGRE